jgi:hypothetical protein
MSGAAYSHLKQFVVTANTTSVTGNMATLAYAPTIVYGATDPYTNVSALPADNAALTFMGTEDVSYSQNLIFAPQAFGLVVLPQEMPTNVWGARFTDAESGMSTRVTKQWDILTNL